MDLDEYIDYVQKNKSEKVEDDDRDDDDEGAVDKTISVVPTQTQQEDFSDNSFIVKTAPRIVEPKDYANDQLNIVLPQKKAKPATQVDDEQKIRQGSHEIPAGVAELGASEHKYPGQQDRSAGRQSNFFKMRKLSDEMAAGNSLSLLSSFRAAREGLHAQQRVNHASQQALGHSTSAHLTHAA